MAIGNAMGIHPGMVAGSVICGAMFGDKLSPLSDTTNLAPAVAGSKLNDHVRSMLWTTLPTFVISLVLFVILGISQTSGFRCYFFALTRSPRSGSRKIQIKELINSMLG